MFVVIFRATIGSLDEDYVATARRMRELALTEFGCLSFVAASEGTQEIALSYWPSLENIRAWREHPEHRAAQERGRRSWYRDYQVEITRVERAYAWPAPTS